MGDKVKAKMAGLLAGMKRGKKPAGGAKKPSTKPKGGGVKMKGMKGMRMK